MKNSILKTFVVVAYFKLAISMEVPEHSSKLPSDNSTLSSTHSNTKSRKKKKSKKKPQKNNALHRLSEDFDKDNNPPYHDCKFDISAQNLCQLLINKDHLSNMADKKSYLDNIQKLLSILNLMEKITSYFQSLNKLNTTLAAIPDYIKYFKSFKSKSELDKDESAWPITIDKMRENEDYIGGVNSSEAKAIVIQSQEILDKHLKYTKKRNADNQQFVDLSLVDEQQIIGFHSVKKQLDKILTPYSSIILRKKIKTIYGKLITSNDTELKILGQWLLIQAQWRKMCEITDYINIELFKIISKISSKTIQGKLIKQSPDGDLFCFDLDVALKTLKINGSFDEWLFGLEVFIKHHIKGFFESLGLIDKTIQFIGFIIEKNRHLNSKENYYLVSITNDILKQFESSKENYIELYQILLQEQKRVFKSVGKKNEYFLRKEYAYNMFTEDQAPFPDALFKPKNKACPISDSYTEHAEKFAKSKQAQELIRQKKQAQRAKEKLKKVDKEKESSFNEDTTDADDYSKENLIEITNDTITSDNLLVAFNGKVKVKLSDYDDRCLSWFNPEFRENKNENDLFYHSFPLGMDYLIKKYGRRQSWPNRTHPGQIDTMYYIGGELQLTDGQKQMILFAITQDPRGTIYHRGLEFKNDNLFNEFASNKFEFDFPKDFEEPEYEVKNVICDLSNLENLTYKLNSFCITLKDTLNNVNIVLFRSSFEPELEN